MKTNFFFSLIVGALINLNFYAQNQGFNYKAIVSDAGSILQNQTISVRFTILENGTSQVYQETHTTTTDDNGIIIVTIGEGNTTDNFSSIDWATTEFLKVEFDTGSGYVDMGTTELKAVPFAKYANYASIAEYVNHSYWNQISNGINSSNPVGIGVSAALEANLHIKDISSLPLLQMESDDNIYTIWKSNRVGTDDYLLGIDGGNNRFIFANTTSGDYPLVLDKDKVGINNLTPSANLDINGSFKLTDGTQGAGKVLTSDANGNASWVSPSTENTFTVYYTPINVQPITNDKDFVRDNKHFYFTETNYDAVYIPINLPVGSIITQITYYYYDNSNTNMNFILQFSEIGIGSQQSFYFSSFGSSGTSTDVQSATLNVSLPINDGYNYGFQIFPTNGSWPGNDTFSFRSIKVTYTM
jgi:hypothetical protein